MNRRAFLHGAGGGSVAALLGSRAGAAPESDDAGGPFLDQERLRNRNSNRSTVACQGGIVCTSQPLASMAGVDVLKAGGNCVDAAIAANAVLGVTEPASNGIGGDLFAILWHEKEGRLFGLNASGRAPYAWSLEKAQELGLESIPGRSPLSWSVPGCVSGWEALSGRFGALPLGRCLEPAIHYASDGLPGLADHRRPLRLGGRGLPQPGRGLPPRRPGPGLRGRLPQPRPRRFVPGDREGRRRRLLRGRDRRAHRREVDGAGRLHGPRRTSPSTRRPGSTR